MRLYGKNPAIERLKTAPKTIRKIYIQNGHPDAGYIYRKAKKWGLPIQAVPKTKIQKIARSVNAQGIVLDVEDFEYKDYQDLLAESSEKKRVLVFLDGITDPQNLGAILRSLACLGNFGIILPTHDSVAVTESVLRVACGGENHVAVAQVKNLSRAIRQAQDAGFRVIGAVVDGGDDIREIELTFPLGLVIGSEHKGVRSVVQKVLDQKVTLPMRRAKLSLNASHATALFCYEIERRKI